MNQKIKFLDFTPAAVPVQWNGIELSGVVQKGDEITKSDEPEFFSLYLKDLDGLSHCIADLPTYSLASDLRDLINKAAANHNRK